VSAQPDLSILFNVPIPGGIYVAQWIPSEEATALGCSLAEGITARLWVPNDLLDGGLGDAPSGAQCTTLRLRIDMTGVCVPWSERETARFHGPPRSGLSPGPQRWHRCLVDLPCHRLPTGVGSTYSVANATLTRYFSMAMRTRLGRLLPTDGQGGNSDERTSEESAEAHKQVSNAHRITPFRAGTGDGPSFAVACKVPAIERGLPPARAAGVGVATPWREVYPPR